MTYAFAWPWVFLALPLPLLAAWLLPRAPANNDAALRLPFYAALRGVSGARATGSRVNARVLIAVLAWSLLVVAAARPQSLGAPLHLPVSGRDLLMAVDLSGSMRARDMKIGNQAATRLAAVKAVASDFIKHRKGDRLGLILFGDQAYTQTPLTFDRKTVTTLLNEAAIGLAGDNTAIGDAIGLAIKRLRKHSDKNRVLILLTDGANTAGSIEPLKAAELAAQEGLRIYTIGVGADTIPVRGFFGTQHVANTELDEKTLRAIADKTGGRYFRARDIPGLQKIYALLDKLEPVPSDEQVYRPVHEWYGWPLAASLVLAVLLILAKTRHAIALPVRPVNKTRHA